MPRKAMVLAAGIGRRMQPLTDSRPKPLIAVAGKSLIDHNLDRLVDAGISTAVINLHHFADMLDAHLRKRAKPNIVFSDERTLLLDTGGGIANALPLLGDSPFFLVNSDSLWLEKNSNLTRLADRFDPTKMDAILLLAQAKNTVGYEGRGDYFIETNNLLRRRVPTEDAPFTYAGGALLSPALFEAAPKGAFPLLTLFDQAQLKGRLFGIELAGLFLHVGTPASIPAAEAAIREFRDSRNS